MSALDWVEDKWGAVAETALGEDYPVWMQGGLIAWAENNPIYQAVSWLDDDEATEYAQSTFDDFPDLKEKMLARWDQKFWSPLYSAVCGMSLPDYNTYLSAVRPKVERMAQAYGQEFVADWYAVAPDGIDISEYVRRRGVLGCAVPNAEVDMVMRRLTPGAPAIPVIGPGGITQKPPWGLIALGGTVVIATVAGLTMWLRKKPKRKRRRRR